MSRHWMLGLFGSCVVALGAFVHDASACMCVRDHVRYLGPFGDDAPINARVRVNTTTGVVDPQEGHRFLLRDSASGAEIPSKVRGPLPPTGIDSYWEIVPSALLAKETRYEVALARPKAFPSLAVFGTFRTGTKEDKTAPQLAPLGKFSVGGLPPPPPPPNQPYVIISSSCGGDTPHVVVGGVSSNDPDRPDAQLLYGVWMGDAAGKIDKTKPEAGLFEAKDGVLTIGASSSCHTDFSFPDPKVAAFVSLGIAAIDEAGNASAMQTIKVSLRR